MIKDGYYLPNGRLILVTASRTGGYIKTSNIEPFRGSMFLLFGTTGFTRRDEYLALRA